LFGLIVGFGFILLIIPGIFFLCRLAFVPYLVVDHKTGAFGAIKGSWKMTKGHFWRIFLLGLTFYMVGLVIIAVFIILSLIFGGGVNFLFYGDIANGWIYQIVNAVIGIPVGIYLMLIWGSLYHAIRLQRGETLQDNPEAASSPAAS